MIEDQGDRLLREMCGAYLREYVPTFLDLRDEYLARMAKRRPRLSARERARVISAACNPARPAGDE